MSENIIIRQSNETILIPEWMILFWEWVDSLPKDKRTMVPREKNELLMLKSLELYAIHLPPDSKKITAEDINNASEEEQKQFIQDYLNKLFGSAREDNSNAYIPREIGMLSNLEELCISMNPIKSLPDEIIQLKKLKRLCLCDNFNLVLSKEQLGWIKKLEEDGVEVAYDDGLITRSLSRIVRSAFDKLPTISDAVLF